MTFKSQIEKIKDVPFIAVLVVICSALISLYYTCFALKDVSAISMWGIGTAIFLINLQSFFNDAYRKRRYELIAFILIFFCFFIGYFNLLLSASISIIALTLFYCGPKSTIRIILPVAIWILAIFNYAQIHFLVSTPMRLAETQIVEFVLNLLNVSVETVGSSIFVAGKEIIITTTCSGVEHIWTIILFAFIFVEVKLSNNFDKFICIITSLPIFVFCNALRVICVILSMQHFGDIVLTDETIHTLSGVATILLAMVMFVAFGLLFAKVEQKVEGE